MNNDKLLGLLGAAVATLAFAASASATTLTGPNGELKPTPHFASEGHVKTTTPIGNVECPSTIEYEVTAHGNGGPVEGKVIALTFGHVSKSCTDSWHATVVAPGKMKIHYKAAGEGTVTSSEMTVTKTRLGITCNYLTNNTVIGTITDKTKAGNGLGTIDVSGEIPIHSGSSGLCGGSSKWTGSYSSATAITLHEKI
ncbi:MAG TPA: hypothetical protein VFS54_02890 [Solirubrobacterales bacterium]|nr:hypothetical protein [Solirubrobacterales bacterium]